MTTIEHRTLPRVIGLDLSLTATGVCVAGEPIVNDHPGPRVELATLKPPAGLTGLRRLSYLRGEVRDVASLSEPVALIVIEGLAYASVTGKASERAGLWWMVRDALDTDDYRVAVVTPAARAKYATGRGNAGKDQVLAAVIRRYPEVLVEDNNQADALVLAAMGLDWLGWPLATVPQTHRAALDAVQWPEVTR